MYYQWISICYQHYITNGCKFGTIIFLSMDIIIILLMDINFGIIILSSIDINALSMDIIIILLIDIIIFNGYKFGKNITLSMDINIILANLVWLLYY